MINEIPKTEGLTPQPNVRAPQKTAPMGGVTALNRSAPAQEGPALPQSSSDEASGVGRTQAQDLAQGLQQLVQTVQRQLNFKVDVDTGRTVIQVIDSTTDEVVRQIPPDGLLALQQRLAEIQDAVSPADKGVIDGMLFSTKA